jgi:hypothetical protein
MPGQAALDQVELAPPNVGDVDRVFIFQAYDRGDIGLGVELSADRKHDPNQAEREQQRDDEQRTRDEIAFGLDERGERITERGGDGSEQE